MRPLKVTSTLDYRPQTATLTIDAPVPDKKLAYRSDIDGLRAIAVLSVVAYHFFQGRVRGGFVGVDIFFVISGYLISSVIYKDLEANAFSITEFYVRRIRRIYPALFIVLVSVCTAGWILLLPTAFALLGKQVAGGSTFVANFVLWWQSGYFSPEASQKPLLNLWSLGVEEQFYLAFPLICVASYRAKSPWILSCCFLVIGMVSMVLNVAFVSRYRAATYFLPPSRLWELLVGAALSLYLQHTVQTTRKSHLAAKWRTGIGFLGFGLLISAIFGIDQYDSFPGWWAILPTLGAALVIAAGEASWVNRHILSWKPAVFVGLISYPLYLWHWPILSFTRIATNSIWDHDISHALKGALLLLSLVLAYLTYRFVELPIRRVRETSRRRTGAMWLLGCVSITGAAGVLVSLAQGFPSRLPAKVVALDHDYGEEAARAYREGTCFLRTDQKAEAFRETCLDPVEGHASLIFVWGDSHAADLVPGFRAIQRESGVRLAQYTASLCAPILGLQVNRRPACKSVNDAVFNRIKRLVPGTVVLSARWDYLDPAYSRAEQGEMLLQTIEAVKSAGVKRVVVIGTAPFWTSGVPSLLIGELRRDPDGTISGRLARSLLEAHDDSLLRAVTQRAGAVYVPLLENLCNQTDCLVATGAGWKDVMTYDNAHFTEHGSVLVAQRIWPFIIGSRE